MKINQIISENSPTVPGIFIHETDALSAENIKRNGFRQSPYGIFFNAYDTGYSGGQYGGSKIYAKLHITHMLDLSDENNMPDGLDEFAEGEELAEYTKLHGYQAWEDGMQIAVLDPTVIEIIKVEIN